jgi:dihydroorotase
MSAWTDIESGRMLLKGARLFDPVLGLDEVADLLLVEGRIEALGPGLEDGSAERLELEGLRLVPGFIDLRARFGEPGREERETVSSGLCAAAAGGFVAVCVTPETDPVTDNQGAVEFLLARAAGHAATLLPLGAVTRGLLGERLADMGELARAGVVGYCEGNRGLPGAAQLRGALSYSRMFGLPLFDRPLEASLSGGEVHEGLVSLRMGLKGEARLCEELGVLRGIRVAEYEGAMLHLQLLSTAESLDAVRQAKARGAGISCDASPQHLALRDLDALDFDPGKRLQPPLRPEADRQALLAAAVDGTLDALCSDHRPADFDELDREYAWCPFGCASLETAVAVAHAALVESGLCGFGRLVELFSAGPRRVLGLPPGRIAVGEPAEFSLFESCDWIYRGAEAQTFGGNSPWEGQAFRLRPAGIVNGERAWLRG